MSTDLKSTLKARLRDRFNVDTVADSLAVLMAGQTVKQKYEYRPELDSEGDIQGYRRTLVEETVTIKPADVAKGLVVADHLIFDGQLGLAPRSLRAPSTKLYELYADEVDDRVIQNNRVEHDSERSAAGTAPAPAPARRPTLISDEEEGDPR